MNKLTPEMQRQLDQLKDIHLPEPISWWPLAFGWWILFAIVLAVCVALVVRHYRRRVYRAALAELYTLRTDNNVKLAQNLSALLKRVALYCGRDVESLSGYDWANYLEEGGFEATQAEFIAFASYANTNTYAAPNWQRMQVSAKRWIKRQF